MKYFWLVAVVAISISMQLHAHSFMPENDLWIGVNEKSNGGGITEKEFNDVLDSIEAVYKPLFKKQRGADFRIQRNWTDGTVNAYAFQRGSSWYISMFGGLARHKTVTRDGFMLVACHEVGHHLGGAPKKYGWASVEGQSDYYGTGKCLKRMYDRTAKLPDEEHEYSLDNLIGWVKCHQVYGNSKQAQICKKSIMAGKSLANLLADLRRSPHPKFSTPDPTKVSRTNGSHPAAQCRLDTYMQGALCVSSYKDEFDDKNPNINSCFRSGNFKIGNRPQCWYKPQ